MTIANSSPPPPARDGLAELDRVELVYNGLGLDRFAWAPAAEASADPGVRGRLVEEEGFGDLLEACAATRLRRSRLRLSS
ncbi:MAG: hypothetical protein R3E53_15165 [Myxococcota bacterium]